MGFFYLRSVLIFAQKLSALELVGKPTVHLHRSLEVIFRDAL